MVKGYDLFPSVGTYPSGKEGGLTPNFLSLSRTQSRREEKSHTRSYVETDLLVPSAFSELGDLNTLRELLHLKTPSSEGLQGHGQMNLGVSVYRLSTASIAGMLM